MSWRDDAACRPGSGARPQDFSPVDTRGRLDLARAEEVATEFCAGCPVRMDCLTEALHNRAAGCGPQELVVAGFWFPVDRATNPNLINLVPLAATGAAA